MAGQNVPYRWISELPAVAQREIERDFLAVIEQIKAPITPFDALIDPTQDTDASAHVYPSLAELLINETWASDTTFNVAVKQHHSIPIFEGGGNTIVGQGDLVLFGLGPPFQVSNPGVGAGWEWGLLTASSSQQVTYKNLYFDPVSGCSGDTQVQSGGTSYFDDCVFGTNIAALNAEITGTSVVCIDCNFQGDIAAASGGGVQLTHSFYNCVAQGSVTYGTLMVLHWYGGEIGGTVTVSSTCVAKVIAGGAWNLVMSATGSACIFDNMGAAFQGSVAISSTVTPVDLKGNWGQVVFSGTPSADVQRSFRGTCTNFDFTGPGLIDLASTTSSFGAHGILRGDSIRANLGMTEGRLECLGVSHSLVTANFVSGAGGYYTLDASTHNNIFIFAGTHGTSFQSSAVTNLGALNRIITEDTDSFFLTFTRSGRFKGPQPFDESDFPEPEPGPPGLRGKKGATGATGSTGSAGARGKSLHLAPGEDGDEGEQGPPGIRGRTGAKGTTGNTGATGATGRRGKDGPAVVLEPDAPDDPVPGPRGRTGAKGAKGDKGDPGAGSTPHFAHAPEPFDEYERLACCGDIKMIATRNPQNGWLICDGAAVSRTTYASLFGALCQQIAGTVTITTGSPGTFNLTAHGFVKGDPVMFTTTGTMWSGGAQGVNYFVISTTTNTFTVGLTPPIVGDIAMPIVTDGHTGTLTAWYAPYGLGDFSTTFNVPDMRNTVPLGHANYASLDGTYDGAQGYLSGATSHTHSQANMTIPGLTVPQQAVSGSVAGHHHTLDNGTTAAGASIGMLASPEGVFMNRISSAAAFTTGTGGSGVKGTLAASAVVGDSAHGVVYTVLVGATDDATSTFSGVDTGTTTTASATTGGGTTGTPSQNPPVLMRGVKFAVKT